MKKRFTARPFIVSSMLLVLAGCTLHPERLSDAQCAECAAGDQHKMCESQAPVRGRITLSEAMARALKYNLDIRLKSADAMLACSDYGVTKYEMLPDFVINGSFISRSNIFAVTNPQGTALSYSQDRHRRVADLQLTWNILDFGVSYIKAKQKGDQYLISLERRRKMQQNIIRDVRYAYFRAVTAQRAIRDIDPLIGQVQRALRESLQLEQDQTQSPVEALRYQKSLLETMRQLTTLRKQLADARRELGALMNIAPGQRFMLSESISGAEVLPRGFPLRHERLEYIALQNRPEIREEDYRTRISANEITKARLRMYPGFEVISGLNTDSNSFLLYNNWTNVGAQITWNLMRLLSGPTAIEHAKKQLLVANVHRMALSMAVLTQVDVALLRYQETQKELAIATKEKAVNIRIYAQMQEAVKAKKKNQMDLIRARTEMVLSQLRYDLMYAEWQNAAGQLVSSVGYDMIPCLNVCDPIPVLERKLNMALNTEPAWVLQHRMPGVYRVTQAEPEIKAVIANNKITDVKVTPQQAKQVVANKPTSMINPKAKAHVAELLDRVSSLEHFSKTVNTASKPNHTLAKKPQEKTLKVQRRELVQLVALPEPLPVRRVLDQEKPRAAVRPNVAPTSNIKASKSQPSDSVKVSVAVKPVVIVARHYDPQDRAVPQQVAQAPVSQNTSWRLMDKTLPELMAAVAPKAKTIAKTQSIAFKRPRAYQRLARHAQRQRHGHDHHSVAQKKPMTHLVASHHPQHSTNTANQHGRYRTHHNHAQQRAKHQQALHHHIVQHLLRHRMPQHEKRMAHRNTDHSQAAAATVLPTHTAPRPQTVKHASKTVEQHLQPTTAHSPEHLSATVPIPKPEHHAALTHQTMPVTPKSKESIAVKPKMEFQLETSSMDEDDETI